jgi:MAF protein
VRDLRRGHDHLHLILASASPRRRHLLGLLGLPFEVVVADVDETPLVVEAPESLASRLALSKALEIASTHLNAIILAADTVVALGDRLLGKPVDAGEAVTMLRALRGRPHRVLTGLVVRAPSGAISQSVTTTTVWMREYTDEEIERYVATGRPLDKAGGYAIQDPEFRPVAQIEGCYPNVVGLPLCEVGRALAKIGLVVPDDASQPPSGCGDLCALARDAEPPA